MTEAPSEFDDDELDDDTELAFFATLGKAITVWAEIDEVLFEITHKILGCNKRLASIVFYKHTSISVRLSLINDLIAAHFPQHLPGEHPDETVVKWRQIHKRISQAIPFRNHLAHHPVGPVIQLIEDPDGDSHTVIISHASHKSAPMRHKDASSSEDAYDIDDIFTHYEDVKKIVNDIRNFARPIGRRQAKQN